MGMLIHNRHSVVIEKVVEVNPLPPNPVEETTEESKEYTKTEIAKMSVAQLRELASELGYEDVENTSGSKLKEILVAHFNL